MKLGKFQFNYFKRKNRFFTFNAESIYKKSYIYNSLVIAICSYFTAAFIAKAIAPFIPEVHTVKPQNTSHVQKDLSQFDYIYTRNLFNEKGLIPELDASKFGNGVPVKSTLPLNLMGVIIVQDSLKSVASVEDKASNQVLAVRVNDPLTTSAIVQKIETNKVIFFNKNSGRREFIDLPDNVQVPSTRHPKATAGNGIQQTSQNRYLIDRKLVDKTLANLPVALTQARCVPNFEGSQAAGYRCSEIVPGSIYEQIGMKNGDVICGINGQSINDPAKAFEIFGQLKSANNIEVCINRNGTTSNISYDIN